MSPGHVLQLQRSIGNRAVTHLLSRGGQPVIQRVIDIGGETITHGSRKVNALFTGVVMPEMERLGFKTYGIKSRLVDYIKNNDLTFRSNQEFLQQFGAWLGTQTRNVKGGKTTPVLKKFDIGSLARPKWSDALKGKLGFQGGDNIRHVIRNATLKRALQIEFNKYGGDLGTQKRRMEEIAAALGVNLTPTDTIDKISAQIYNHVYLNEANLFSGQGPYNQIIGFSADTVKNYGEELIGMGDDMVSPAEVFETVRRRVIDASLKVGIPVPNPVTDDLTSVLQAVIVQTTESGQKIDFIEAEELGDLIADIGLNFGFDLIDGRVPEDQGNVSKRQGMLIKVETALQTFIGSDGGQGDLKTIFAEFMSITR